MFALRLAMLLLAAAQADPPGAAPAGPVSPAPVLPAPTSFASAGLGASGLAPGLRPFAGATGLVGLSSVGDPAPQCRSRCAQVRYVCESGGDDGACARTWGQCTQTCEARRAR